MIEGFVDTTGQTVTGTRAPDPAVAVLEAEVERLRGLLARTIPHGTLIGESYDPPVPADETIRECWMTWGTLRDIRATLNPAPSEKEAG